MTTFYKGVKGLESFTNKKKIILATDITEQLRGKTLVVDLSSLEGQFRETLPSRSFDLIDGKQADKLDDALFAFSSKLNEFGIKQLWIKDG